MAWKVALESTNSRKVSAVGRAHGLGGRGEPAGPGVEPGGGRWRGGGNPSGEVEEFADVLVPEFACLGVVKGEAQLVDHLGAEADGLAPAVGADVFVNLVSKGTSHRRLGEPGGDAAAA